MRRKLAVFYHIWTSPDPLVARFLVDEQLKRLIRSGLREAAEVFCVITGSDEAVLEPVLAHYPWVTVLERNSPQDQFEIGTYRHLYRYCQENPDCEGVLYFHTKGLIYYTNPEQRPGSPDMVAVNTWRHLMEWALIDRWREALEGMEGRDMAGCSPAEGPFLHYPGNFWWARPSYIAGLPDPLTVLEANRGPDPMKMRLVAEIWPAAGTELNRMSICGQFWFPEDLGGLPASPYHVDMDFGWLRRTD